MRGIGVHVCEGCGAIYDTIGAYLDCVESHEPAPDPGLPAGRTATAGTERVTVLPIVGNGVIHGAFSESVGDYTHLPRREGDDE